MYTLGEAARASGKSKPTIAKAIRTGTPALTDGRSGLRVLEILQAASESMANGGATIALETGE